MVVVQATPLNHFPRRVFAARRRVMQLAFRR